MIAQSNYIRCCEDTCRDQEGIAWKEKADEKAGFDENDSADQRSAAGADKFLQPFRIVKRVEKMEKRLEHATWFLIMAELASQVSQPIRQPRRRCEKPRASRRENVYSHTVAENAGVAARFDEAK